MPSPPLTPIPTAFRAFDERLPREGARVLVLGRLPEAAVARRWTCVRPDELGRSHGPGAPFDGAWIADCLEHEEWDRWLLQQVHAQLRDGAPLVLVVPDRGAWLTPGGLGFFAMRALARIRRRLTPGAPPPAFAGRRYGATDLARMLAASHFEPTAPLARDGRGRLVASARRLPGLAARLRLGNAPDPAEFVRGFSAANERFERIRDHWLERHPGLAPAGCSAFEPTGHAGDDVLVLAPHPDDELVGAGGTLIRLARHGARITILHATDGGASAALLREPDAIRTTVRLEEARRVGEALGAARIEFWKEDNRAFRVREETVARLRALLEEVQPRLIVTPFVTDIHPDHFTLNRILEGALAGSSFDAGGCRILYSEIWSHLPANTICDVTSEEEEVERLILMYTTAMKVDDLPRLCESRYYFNSCRLLGRAGFAEAFYSIPAFRHAELLATGGPPHE